MSGRVVHASKELIAAMNGDRPLTDPGVGGAEYSAALAAIAPACGAQSVGSDKSLAAEWGAEDDQTLPDCPDCRALFPNAIQVRLDDIETRTGKRP